jgi:predicted nucleic acid-binding protein
LVIVDSSAWIEYFRDSGHVIIKDIEHALEHDVIVLGDLIYCEILQGIKSINEERRVKFILTSLYPRIIGGFAICEKAAQNYKLLRAKGATIRKTIDVIIGTFCIENNYSIIHNDRDFGPLEKILGLKNFKI